MNKSYSQSLLKYFSPGCAGLILSLVALVLVGRPAPARAVVVVTNLFSFNGTNGSDPTGQLAQTSNGVFYGSTVNGGTNGGYGTLFKMSSNVVTTVFTFNSTNGYQPKAGMIVAKDGNLYGTTALGGTNINLDPYGLGYGTAFRLNTNGTFTNLASFNKTNGYLPNSLVQATNGIFYGTGNEGGVNTGSGGITQGTIFKMDTNGSITKILDYNGTNGSNPFTGLTLYTNGTLYGLTTVGTVNNSIQFGTIFQTTTNGVLTGLDSFYQTNGNTPTGLILANDGNFYGICAYGGLSDKGTIFRVKPDGTFTNLFSFNGTNGSLPEQIIQAADGNLYGVTGSGGTYTNGVFFQCSLAGGFSNLYSFVGTNDGVGPTSIMQGQDGSFYGTSGQGGSFRAGNIFKLSLAPTPNIQSITVISGVAQVSFATANGLSYLVQYKTNLIQSSWSNLTTLTATNSLGIINDPVGTNISKFYRVALTP